MFLFTSSILILSSSFFSPLHSLLKKIPEDFPKVFRLVFQTVACPRMLRSSPTAAQEKSRSSLRKPKTNPAGNQVGGSGGERKPRSSPGAVNEVPDGSTERAQAGSVEGVQEEPRKSLREIEKSPGKAKSSSSVYGETGRSPGEAREESRRSPGAASK